jgi:uncharacterized protein YbjT (DUF2867 family)
VDVGFQVTVLTRAKKPDVSDPGFKVLEVDFTSLESLTAALQGIDAVVSTVAGHAHESQLLLIDAAVAAGVKRFIPSEFGSCTTSPKVQNLPIYSTMAKVRGHLQEKAQTSQITWSVLACGGFLDWLFKFPILLDFTNHKATLLDEGNNRISSTSLANISKAVVAILKNFDATKNKVLHSSEIILTQNEVLAIAQELEPETKWDINKINTKVLLKDTLQTIGQGDFSMPVMMNILKATAFGGDEYGSAYDETDNKLLGIKELTKDDLKNLIVKNLA